MLSLVSMSLLKADEKLLFFKQRIEPVLEEHCYSCHSAAANSIKGGLRLDTRSAIRRGGESGPAVVPGKVEESLLLAALRYEGLEMPPNAKLPNEVIQDFIKWIESGAVDSRLVAKSEAERREKAKSHWAFQRIERPVVPASNSRWIRNDVDQFILSKLRAEEVKPSPEADPRTLIRRLFLDLIGLPPTPQETQAFLDDPSEANYQKTVSDLLGSPHYGERWGRYWLDMARYADSNGYEADRPRPHAWRWRDWVINSLNDSMPFDQFTIEQLAGDLLPNATLEQRVATGFNRNTLVNTEGGVDREEDRVKRTVDRTNTVGKVWLGLTLGCTQCHSHKYDPITQHEYYGMYAFFNSLAEPDIPAPTPEQLADFEIEFARHQAQHQQNLHAVRDYRSEKMSQWEQDLSEQLNSAIEADPDRVDNRFDKTWELVNPLSLSATSGSQFFVEDDLAVFVNGPNDQEDTYTIVTETSLSGITAIRLEVLADERLAAKGPGLAGNGNFVLSSLRVYVEPVSDNDDRNMGQRIRLKTARADFSQGGRQVTSVIGDDPADGWAIYPDVGVDHYAVFELREKINSVGDSEPVRITIQMDHQTHKDHNIGKFRLSFTTHKHPVPDGLETTAFSDLLSSDINTRRGEDVIRLVKYFGYRETELDKLIDAVKSHQESFPRSPKIEIKAQVVMEMPNPRTTQVHVRGSFLDKGDLVTRTTPSILPELVTGNREPSRLDLAKWLVSSENPLTARVIVNRIWQQHFGRGIVVSDDDFGTQGEPPTHPELLDWLAAEFRETGWNMKQLHRLIVTSATWRQSSFSRPELKERDPYNSWLARQNRLRVEAEIIRDMALSASGLIFHKIGGRSVYPPQPADLVKLGFQTSLSWPENQDQNRYRRGIYTFFQRTVPYPMLIEFDAADSNAACTRRERSNTPLQALTLWNDPVFVECAQHLGARLLKEVPADEDNAVNVIEKRIRLAYELCFSRPPSKEELQVVGRLYKEAADKDGVQTDLVAAFAVARVLLNLDEFITRE
ncbi:MAG: PSD1 and planctomycete cytochrome C domain-containing protein [Pirellulales bacterium]|nr:PSD1 and planctomycete cytochrome C domain-containing protein [Pirellulales bacterium]